MNGVAATRDYSKEKGFRTRGLKNETKKKVSEKKMATKRPPEPRLRGGMEGGKNGVRPQNRRGRLTDCRPNLVDSETQTALRYGGLCLILKKRLVPEKNVRVRKARLWPKVNPSEGCRHQRKWEPERSSSRVDDRLRGWEA